MFKKIIGALLALGLLTTVCVAAEEDVDTDMAEAVEEAEDQSPFGSYRQTIAAGFQHSVAVDGNGNVQVWGDNSQSQLGQVRANASADSSSALPVQLPNMSSVISVAAGDYFSAALTERGLVYLWGSGAAETSAVPKMQDGIGDVIQISACQDKIAALRNDGTVYAWVRGARPAQIAGLENIAAIAVGGDFSLALEQTGDVWTWSDGAAEKVAGLSGATAIAAGHTHALAVTGDGSAWAWGDNSNGQLGLAAPAQISAPGKIPEIQNADTVYAGNRTSAVITADNTVYTFGYGEYGQLGNESGAQTQHEPRAISVVPEPQDGDSADMPSAVRAIAFGQHHALAIDSLGELYSWGRDSRGQLGLGGNENVNRPQWLGETIKGLLPERLRVDMYSGADEWALLGSAGFAYGDGLQSFNETGLAPMRIFSHFTQRITREEFAYAVVNMYAEIDPQAQMTSAKANSFRDINNSPYKDQILKAYSLGIINGLSNTVFAPEDSISRQDAATMVDRFINKMLDRPALPADAYSITRVYSDGTWVAEYARAAVINLYNDNIMVGSGNRFNPRDLITRQEVFMILQRTIMKYNFTKAA